MIYRMVRTFKMREVFEIEAPNDQAARDEEQELQSECLLPSS